MNSDTTLHFPLNRDRLRDPGVLVNHVVIERDGAAAVVVVCHRRGLLCAAMQRFEARARAPHVQRVCHAGAGHRADGDGGTRREHVLEHFHARAVTTGEGAGANGLGDGGGVGAGQLVEVECQ